MVAQTQTEAQKQCPNCDSFKTWTPKRGLFWGGLIFALLSLPWVLIIVGIFPLIAGLLVMLCSFGVPKGQVWCRNCKLKWTPEG